MPGDCISARGNHGDSADHQPHSRWPGDPGTAEPPARPFERHERYRPTGAARRQLHFTTPTRSTAMKTMETMGTKKTRHISRRFRRFVRANEAVSALEYAILVGVIAVGSWSSDRRVSGQRLTAAIAALGTSVTTASEVKGAKAITPSRRSPQASSRVISRYGSRPTLKVRIRKFGRDKANQSA